MESKEDEITTNNKAKKLNEVMNQDEANTLLAQWQTCVEMANSVSERRDNTNNLFVTLNLAVIAAISIIWDIKSVLLAVAGLVICVVWFLFINNFKELNKAKFEVINSIEEKLPISAFQMEWKILKQTKKYKESTKLEKVFPIMFGIVYVAILICIVFLQKGAC